ncbi:hypothetical protein CR513_03413, partial [Mucuna pruriens]
MIDELKCVTQFTNKLRVVQDCTSRMLIGVDEWRDEKHKDGDIVNKACEVCFRDKQTREKIPLSEHKASNVFELIHCDLWGAYRTLSTYAMWVYLLINKQEVLQMLHNFIALIEKQFCKQVKILKSDHGKKFTCMKRYFLDHEIIFQTFCT